MELDWYRNEIIDGLTKLMSLSLDRTPAADLVQLTAATWIDATTAGRDWDQTRDTPRIRGAFSTLASTREQWPAPRHFIDALPRVEQRALGYEVKPLGPVEAAVRMAEIKTLLGEPLPTFKPDAPDAEPIDKAAIERDLQQHYSDRKSAAAGDS